MAKKYRLLVIVVPNAANKNAGDVSAIFPVEQEIGEGDLKQMAVVECELSEEAVAKYLESGVPQDLRDEYEAAATAVGDAIRVGKTKAEVAELNETAKAVQATIIKGNYPYRKIGIDLSQLPSECTTIPTQNKETLADTQLQLDIKNASRSDVDKELLKIKGQKDAEDDELTTRQHMEIVERAYGKAAAEKLVKASGDAYDKIVRPLLAEMQQPDAVALTEQELIDITVTR